MKKLHLLLTEHGKLYWRYNDADSDESRSPQLIASILCKEEDAEKLGRMWEIGVGSPSIARFAEDIETAAEMAHYAELEAVMREDAENRS